MSKLALNSAHISTFPLPYPSRQTFSFSSALCHVFLPFPLLRYHFPLTLRPVLLSLTTRLSPLFFPYPLLCLLIFLPLSTCLLTLFFPMHFLSFPSLFHSPVPLFFLSHTSLFRPSPLFPLRILPFFHPLVYPLFFHPHTSFFLLSAPSTLSFSFSSLYSSRLFCSPFSFIPFLSYTHSHTSLPPLSPVLAFLTFFLSPLFHIHRPFFRASRCPSLQKQSCRSFLYGTKKRKTAASRFLIATIC